MRCLEFWIWSLGFICNLVFGAWNFHGHWDLFVIWFLVLGIFMIFNKQPAFSNSIDYLIK
jgi:hypothetical protein